MTSTARQAIAQQSAERVEMSEAAQFSPALLSAVPELEHHLQDAVTAETSLGALGSVADRGKGTLDWV